MQPDEPASTPPVTPQSSDTNSPTPAPAAPVAAEQPVYSDDDTRDISARVTYEAGFAEADDEAVTAGDETAVPAPAEVSWQAKEYIAPDKNTIWYICLGIVVVAVVLLDLFYVHSYTLTALIIAIAVVLIVMSVRPARVINYKLSDEGLYIGETLINLDEYKAFGVIHDGKENSLFLIPIKRFKPGLSVYFPVESGESIVDNLGQRLPMQEIRLDFIDNIVRLLRL